MTESSSVATVRRFDTNLGSPEVLMEVTRVLGDFDDWKTEASELIDAGNRVIGRGAYSGRCKATGKRFSAQFVHVWTVAGNQIVVARPPMDRYADSCEHRPP